MAAEAEAQVGRIRSHKISYVNSFTTCDDSTLPFALASRKSLDALSSPRQAHVRQLRGKPIQPGQPLLFDAKPTRRKARAPGPLQPSDETGPAAPQTCLSYELQNGASQ